MIRALKAVVSGVAVIGVVSAAAADDDDHRTSAYISAAITAGLPRFSPKENGGDAASATADPERKPAGSQEGVTAMPAFTVRESKIPTEERILSYKGSAKVAMDRYLGPADGFDRGVLNRFTLPQLWKKIPILGWLPFVGTPAEMSNEERGFDAGGANNTLPHPQPPKEKE
jgi:hypothetical protein